MSFHRLAIATVSVFAAGAAVMVQVPAEANQPNMKAALTNLNQARENLERANSDKGGHRVKAMRLIDEAIEEVKEGIRSGRM
jgi:hypothetical protein